MLKRNGTLLSHYLTAKVSRVCFGGFGSFILFQPLKQVAAKLDFLVVVIIFVSNEFVFAFFQEPRRPFLRDEKAFTL